MDSVLEFLNPKLILFLLGFWSSVSTYLLHLLRYFTRFASNGCSSKGKSTELTEAIEGSLKVTESNMVFEEKQDFLEFSSKDHNWVDPKEDEKEATDFSFTFKFPTFEEFSKNQKDFSRLVHVVEVEPSSPVSENNFSESIDSSEASLEDSEADTNSNGELQEEQYFRSGVYQFPCTLAHASDNDESKDDFEDQEVVRDEMMVESSNEKNKIDEMEDSKELDKLQKEAKMGSNNRHSPVNYSHGKDEFLTDVDFEAEFNVKEQNNWKSDFLSENNFGSKSRNTTEREEINGSANGGEKSSSNDTTNKLESLWEHQELIEQLKMEIKKVKATGLPTIFEESESPPKMMEDLKPWNIEEVYQHGGGGKMSEVHKFYKSYRDRMRKFDIFNYQKMYAIGFLQLKDPVRSSPTLKSSVLEITTLLNQIFTTTKGKKHENDPTVKFIKELQTDLEVVYVGQMCLSWEILHWQYEKALDIWESDTHGLRRFNEIAGEFQQFQVLMQRFIEDEPFQGPRVQNYVKSRCVFRNLLQVPIVKEDHPKNRKARSEVICDITSDTLVEILEETIRVFWRFLRADKYRRQTPVEFQKPEDSQIFVDLQKDLHKKERKLKEQLRSGKCILRKLRGCRREEEGTEDEVLYFFSEVDMKLVSRVLEMSRLTTDQLTWCHNKLSKLSFLNRKIHVEPSFLLFPC